VAGLANNNWKNCHPVAGAVYAYIVRTKYCVKSCCLCSKFFVNSPVEGAQSEIKLYMCVDNKFEDVTAEALKNGGTAGPSSPCNPTKSVCSLPDIDWPGELPVTCAEAFTLLEDLKTNPLP
jgi:hypothetical protein